MAIRYRSFVRTTARSEVVVGAALVSFVLLVAFLGPAFAPRDPDQLIGVPFSSASSDALLGTDVLGRDVLSRLVSGGRTILLASIVSVILAYAIGLTIGILAALNGSRAARSLLRSTDVVLSFPPMLLVLIIAAANGVSLASVVMGAVIAQVPGISRFSYAASSELTLYSFVESAKIRGESLLWLIGRELLPNMARPIAADAGIRITLSILLIAAANFLGVGTQPPNADWGAMLAENSGGLESNPMAILAPALMIGCVTVGVSFLADALSTPRRLRTSEANHVVKDSVDAK